MRTSLLCIAIILFAFTSSQAESDTTTRKAKYIFYFIGDGYGIAHATFAEDYLASQNKQADTKHLAMNGMPIQGYASTFSANKLITCSSAAGTALACGTKTNNGMLGISPENKKLKSIAEFLHENSYKIGIITSVSLDHATPAAFYANTEKRSNYLDVSKQLAISGFEYFGGGSLLAAYEDKNIWNDLKSNGYFISNNKDVISKRKLHQGKMFAESNVISNKADIPYCIDSPKHDMPLSFFVKNAINYFGNEAEKFFIMVEGGKIDWACHSNDVGGMLFEILEFDNAYKAALQFYEQHPEETLIIITSDHETGGFTVGQKAQGYDCYPQLVNFQRYSEVLLRYKIDSTLNGKKNVKDAYAAGNYFFGFNSEEKKLKLNHSDSCKIEALFNINISGNKTPENYLSHGLRKNETFCTLFLQIFDEKIGVGWTSGVHTGAAVPVRAIGVGAELFNGYYDNTDIPKKILHIAGFDETLN